MLETQRASEEGPPKGWFLLLVAGIAAVLVAVAEVLFH